jgi:Ser/Thr protein kinase RdoA (MazF antagonist)
MTPDWPPLTLTELAPVLASYEALGTPEALVWHSQRPFAASAIVRTGAGLVFAKRHDPRVRGREDLAEEHAFMAHLRGAGARVPALLSTRNGETAIRAGSGVYELHAPGEGEDVYRDAPSWQPARSLEDAAAMGQALGELHNQAAGFDAPARRTCLLVAGDALLRAPDLMAGVARLSDDCALLARALSTRDWREELDAACGVLHAALPPHRDAMTPLWGHGDFHASNLLWRDGRVSCVLDFGLANRVSAVFDLATAIERNAIAWLELSPGHTDIGRPELARALLHGYDEARKRPPAERRALRHVLPLVHLDFALSELAYFHGITLSASNEDAAYHDFLLGHARWFAGLCGRRFLDLLPD